MKHVFVRPVKKDPQDIKQMFEFQKITEDNLYDAEVLNYPTTFVLCAYDKTGPLVYVPIQQPLFMESLGIKPGLSEVDTAVALKELTQALVHTAHVNGHGEIYFMCKEESTIEYAKRQCFEEVPWKVLRVKLSDLEPKVDTPTATP